MELINKRLATLAPEDFDAAIGNLFALRVPRGDGLDFIQVAADAVLEIKRQTQGAKDDVCAARGGETSEAREYDAIAVDFDGTLCEDRFPEIGEPKRGVIEFVKRHSARGAKIILHTCRENTPQRAALDEAVEFCATHGIPLYAVNENPSNPYGQGRKVYADLYVDDKAVNASDIERAEWFEALPARIAAMQERLDAMQEQLRDK
jgi:hypothetical protein